MVQISQDVSNMPEYTVATPVNILLVEDNVSDAEYTRIMLDETDILYKLERLKKGNEVIPYLTHKGAFAKGITPDLIILDLGLPCQDGFEVLNDLELMSSTIRGVPIIILTEYENFAYLKKTHNLCIMDYITKPCSTPKLQKILTDIVKFRDKE